MTCTHPNRGTRLDQSRVWCPDCGADLGMFASMPSADSGLGFDSAQPVVLTIRRVAHLIGNARWRGPLDAAALAARGIASIETHGFRLDTVPAEKPRTEAEVMSELGDEQ